MLIINLLLKIFILAGFGYGVKKIGLIKDEVESGLNQLLVKAILPVTILLSSQNNYSKELLGNMCIIIGITISYYLVAILLMTFVTKILHLEDAKRRLYISMSVFANVGFIGFPVVFELFSKEGLLYAVVYNIVFQIIFFSYGVSLISGEKVFKIKMIYTNPVTIASILCLIFFVCGIKIPEAILAPLQSIGGMTTPISLILIGCALEKVKIADTIKDWYSFQVAGIRMILFPIVIYFVLFFAKVDPMISGIVVILTGLPSGSLNVIYSKMYHCEEEFASRTVVLTMVLMVITLPLTMFVLNH